MTINFPWFSKNKENKAEPPVFNSSISNLSIFSSLGPNELKLINEKIRHVEYKKGDVVYHLGEEATAFYIIFSGRFSVCNAKGAVVSTLGRGDYFGESSILLERPHSATVEAKNDGMVLEIRKKDFLELLNRTPALSVHLSRTLGHRLTRGSPKTEGSEIRIIAIHTLSDDIKRSVFAWNFATMLTQTGKKSAVLVQFEDGEHHSSADARGPILSISEIDSSGVSKIQQITTGLEGGANFLKIAKGTDDTHNDKNLGLLLNYAIDKYDFILLELPKVLKDDLTTRALQQSDLVYFLIDEKERNSPEIKSHFEKLQTLYGLNQSQIRLILSENRTEKINTAASQPTPLPKEIFFVLPEIENIELPAVGATPYVIKNPSSRYAKSVRFLARELTGNLVGLALGSGAAWGFAHIGVLKVLEEEGIQVDLIAGSSIGALIGALWLSGLTAKQIEEITLGLDTKSFFWKLIGLGDFSAPHRGFFKGHQIVRFLRSHIGHRTFRDLQGPLKIVTTNLLTGEAVILDEGDLAEAVRASIAIPGIFRPVRFGDRYLLDGGVVDPLPVKVLNYYGAKKIIAVNVLSTPEENIRRNELNQKRREKLDGRVRKQNLLTRLMWKTRKRVDWHYQPNIFNVLMNTIQFLEEKIAESSELGVDVLIRHVLIDSHWAEFYSGEKFIKEGERQARIHLADIKRLVEEN
jgi:NTE family protein